MRHVRLSSFRVFKRYPSWAQAETARSRADWLAGCGVLTPSGVPSRRGRLVQFPMISGIAGIHAVDGGAYRIDPALFQPIVRLHRLAPDLPLPRFDPLVKIVPRLDKRSALRLQANVANALDVIDRFEHSSSVIHGDLHAGQFIIDNKGSAWLIDLDDMSQGDPAADIGNFAAHLATRGEADRLNPHRSLSLWLQAALAAYSEAGGCLNPALAAAYGRLALVRRALKFRERGDHNLIAAFGGAASD